MGNYTIYYFATFANLCGESVTKREGRIAHSRDDLFDELAKIYCLPNCKIIDVRYRDNFISIDSKVSDNKLTKFLDWLKVYAEGHARFMAICEFGFFKEFVRAVVEKKVIIGTSSDWVSLR